MITGTERDEAYESIKSLCETLQEELGIMRRLVELHEQNERYMSGVLSEKTRMFDKALRLSERLADLTYQMLIKPATDNDYRMTVLREAREDIASLKEELEYLDSE